MKRFIKSIIPKTIKVKYKAYIKRQVAKQIVGDNVFCPICESHFKYFASFGLSERKNARCHNCNSLERHRLLYLYMKVRLNFFNFNKNKLCYILLLKSFFTIYFQSTI